MVVSITKHFQEVSIFNFVSYSWNLTPKRGCYKITIWRRKNLLSIYFHFIGWTVFHLSLSDIYWNLTSKKAIKLRLEEEKNFYLYISTSYDGETIHRCSFFSVYFDIMWCNMENIFFSSLKSVQDSRPVKKQRITHLFTSRSIISFHNTFHNTYRVSPKENVT